MPQMWFNPLVRAILRSPLHGLISANTMLVTYKGSKSGAAYTLPVNYLRQGDAFTVVSMRSRLWWRSLRRSPMVGLLLQGKAQQAMASVVEQPQAVAEALTRYVQQAPQLGRYLGIALDAQGNPLSEELDRAASQRVVISLRPL
jgi:hypothetical protein